MNKNNKRGPPAMAATKKTTLRVRRNPERGAKHKSIKCDDVPTVLQQVRAKKIVKAKKTPVREVDVYRAKVLKVKSALAAGFKQFMINNGRARMAGKLKGKRGIESLYLSHVDNKEGVYTYGPMEDDDMRITLSDITSNMPSNEASNLEAGMITTFKNVSVRVRVASQSSNYVQVNVNPAFTVLVKVDGVGKLYTVQHTDIVSK